ncbi:MAG: hypothetical protein IMZ46_06960 [Acidobacteria bacterium]|nr:hypothetical protein [Acidobacteriota bacterium]
MLELKNGTEMNGVAVNTEATVESMALAGAEAIQHLILERNDLRNRTRAQEKELSALRTTNEDLRRRIGFVHNQYLTLTSKFVAHLNDIDKVIKQSVQDGDPAIIPDPDASLTLMARRFSPAARDRAQ